MAEEYFVGEEATINFTVDNSKKKKKVKVKAEIFEKDNPADILFSKDEEVPGEAKKDISLKWVVVYKGDIDRLKNGNQVEYLFRVKTAGIVTREASMMIKADFFQWQFSYKDPDGNDKALPLEMAIKVKQKKNDDSITDIKIFTIDNGEAKIEFIKPAPDIKGCLFEILFDYPYLNVTKNSLLTKAELTTARNNDKNYDKNNLITTPFKIIALKKDSFTISSGYSEPDNILTKTNEDIKITLKSNWVTHTYEYEDPTSAKKKFPQGTALEIILRKTVGGVNTDQIIEGCIHNNDGKFIFAALDAERYSFKIKPGEDQFLNITDNQWLKITEADLNTKIEEYNKLIKNKMFFSVPEEIPLEKVIWALPADYENATNMIKTGNNNVTLTLTPEWLHLKFHYFNRDSETLAQTIPAFLVIKGYNEDVSAADPVVISNLWKNGIIYIPWILKQNRIDDGAGNARNKEKIVLKFQTKSAWLKKGKIEIIKKSCGKDQKKQIRNMDLDEQFKYFDLPETWVSRNWRAVIDVDKDDFKELINKATTEAKPMIIDLDGITLTDINLNSLAWADDGAGNKVAERFAVFDIHMDFLFNQEAIRPYWNSKDDQDYNFFTAEILYDSGAPKAVRCICYQGDFYDVTDERSVGGDVIGARAAVLEDPRIHHHQLLRQPVAPGAGNFELHYFHNCFDSADNVVGILLIYWACVMEANVASGATANDVRNFQEFGMTNVKDRWEEKDFKFIKTGCKSMEVLPKFYHEDRNIAPPPPANTICHVDIIRPAPGFRSSMGLYTAGFKHTTYQPSGGGTFDWFTMAHELGHGMGLDDEYLESIPEDGNWSPVLPNFNQYYEGMPFSCDDHSMMVRNEHPRLRHFWYYCYWLNNSNPVKNLTKIKEFQVNSTYGGANHNFSLDTQALYTPAYQQQNVTNGANGQFDLSLYKLGDDETGNILIGGVTDIDSILVVKTKIQAFFDDVPPTDLWVTRAQKLDYLRDFQNRVANNLNTTFYLKKNCSAEYFNKIYIYFVPHYHFENGAGALNFVLRVLRNSPSAPAIAGNTLTVGENVNKFRVYKNTLGLADNATAVSALDLRFLAKWVKKQAGGGYTVL